MDKKLIELLKANRREIENTDIEEDSSLSMIKLDIKKYTKVYMIYFNDFQRHFKNLNNEKVKLILQKNIKIYYDLQEYKRFEDSQIDFILKRELQDYIKKNDETISEFIELFLEVFEEKNKSSVDNLLKEITQKLEDRNEDGKKNKG